MKEIEKEGTFLIPVVGQRIYLAQRNTEPYPGCWCAVGGKAEPEKTGNPSPWNEPYRIEKPGGARERCIGDQLRELQGLEPLVKTGVREACEELFPHLRFPQDFSAGDITDIYKIGFVDDEVKVNGVRIKAHNQILLARINRTDFRPSPREIRDFRPISEIPDNALIVPITLTALLGMRYALEQTAMDYELAGYQTPDILPQLQRPSISVKRLDRLRETNILGAVLAFAQPSGLVKNPDQE